MEMDWNKAINEILSEKMSCQACNLLDDQMVVGFTRSSDAAVFAPRCRECVDKSDCEARKLVIVCPDCARKYRVNGQVMDEAGMMSVQIDEVRRSLEESLEYIANLWREDQDVSFEDMEKDLREASPQIFKDEDGWRRRLEEEYLEIHKWFRERKVRIPDPAWRGQYAEDALELGLETTLGD